MTHIPYAGTEYWDYNQVLTWCWSFADAFPEWVDIEVIGKSRMGRDIVLMTLGKNPETTPIFWLDGGTHAAEWTGVMATLYAMSQWSQSFETGEGIEWFEQNAICVVPCISPDGFQAIHEGQPAMRSSLRPPRPGVSRVGLDPCDMDGDGQVRLMRWKDPAGPFVLDHEQPLGLRRRKLSDDPSMACFLCEEGMFLQWDGAQWSQAPLKHGLDLNRNFPVRWLPFQMFGMDGGAFALSEPESRAVMDAVHARPTIAACVTNHTYTGALLTQPYHPDAVLPESDISLMERLAEEAVAGTGYKAVRVHPDFTYDPKQRVIGVWADCLSTTMGIPAYTLELWDPFSWSGVKVENMGAFFRKPDPKVVEKLLAKAVETGSPKSWMPHRHPQLGPVEIGGVDYMQTIRNPPVSLLAAECHRGFQVADAVRRSMPIMRCTAHVGSIGIELFRLTVLVENVGFLSTTSTQRAVDIGAAGGVRLSLDLENTEIVMVEGKVEVDLGRLEGWGDFQVSCARTPIYPSLSEKGHRAKGAWILRGMGSISIRVDGGRAGVQELSVSLG